MNDTHLTITTFTPRGTYSEHWTTTRVAARTLIANYINRNKLRRDSYSDNEQLFDGETHVGHYSITTV